MELGSRPRRAGAFFRKPGEPGGATGGASPSRGIETGAADGGKGAVVCLACGHRLAGADAKISVAGTHTHTFMNPGGYVFEIGCYRDAPGAAGAGAPSAEWSWFPGHVWQIALCRGCRAHVGWSFTGEGGGFFGLVLDRIGESEG